MVFVKPRESDSGSRLHVNICFLIFGGVALLNLAACGLFSSDESASREPLKASANARTEQLKTDLSVDDARKIAKPPESGDGISVNSTTSLDSAAGTAAANGLEPPRGLNNKRLFGESLKNDDERFGRLETAVQGIRDEIDTLSPAIHRLEAVEQDMQELSTQLSALVKGGSAGDAELSSNQLNNDQGAINHALGADGTGPKVASETLAAPGASMPSPNAPPEPDALQAMSQTAAHIGASPNAPPRPPDKPSTSATAMSSQNAQPPTAPSAISSGGPSLVNMRVADNGKKTRLVIETQGSLTYKADLDNGEKILTLSFNKGAMGVNVSSLPVHSKLVKSISGTPQNSGGFVLALTLTHASKIIGQGAIEPNKDSPHNRIFIDLEN